MNESGERSKGEIHNKLKDTEKRLYDLHHEKQELEAKLRAIQKNSEEIIFDNEKLKRSS